MVVGCVSESADLLGGPSLVSSNWNRENVQRASVLWEKIPCCQTCYNEAWLFDTVLNFFFFSSGCRSWKLRLYFDYGSRLLSVIQAAGSGIMVWAIFTLSLYMRSGLHSFIWRVKHGFILYLYILPLFVTKQCSSLLLYKSVMVSLCLIKFNVNKLTQIITGSMNFKGQFQGSI